MENAASTSARIDVLVVEPEKSPYIAQIDNTLKGQQQAVDGLIEYVHMEKDAILVCNEEGLFSKPLNRTFDTNGYEQAICGTFFIAGDGDGNLQSLSENQIVHFTEKFKDPEFFVKVEVDAANYALISKSEKGNKIVSHTIESGVVLAIVKSLHDIKDEPKSAPNKAPER